MTMKLGRMVLFMAGLALCCVADAPDAEAVPVTFDTLSSELCIGAPGCGSVNQAGGDLHVRFTPGTASVDANPTTFSSFGTITVACVGGACNTSTIDGMRLYLYVSQTGPATASGLLGVGTLSGSLAGNNLMLTFDPGTSLTLGEFTYSLVNTPLALVGPQTNRGETMVQARVTHTATPPTPVPEPTSLLLSAAGLGLVGMIRRRTAR